MPSAICPRCGAKLPANANANANAEVTRACRRCSAKLHADADADADASATSGAPNPRDRFREVVVVRPQLAARRGQVKGSHAWPLLVGLVLVALAIATLTLR
jgi:ribosomal protein L40E